MTLINPDFQMNKFKFTIKNALLYYKFWNGYQLNKVEYPEIVDQQEKIYGKPVFVETFENLDQWKIMDRGEWGSARPGNLCTFVKENISVKINGNKRSLVISTTPEEAAGKGWNGEEVIKPISSGLITCKFLVIPGQVVSATVNTTKSYPGSWFSFWLYKKDASGDERYREIDIFEKFMERKDQKKYSVSIHGGSKNSREMMSFSYPMFFVDEEKVTFTCELYQHSAKVFVNGILICIAEEPDFDGEYYIMFNDGPSTHDGKVTEAEIFKNLPKTFEIIDFRIYEKGSPGF
jgi:hypothetical protein